MDKCELKLDTRRVNKDGTFPVRIFVGYGTNLALRTGVSLAPERWNERLQLAIGPGSAAYNGLLGALLLRVQTRVLDLKTQGRFNTMKGVELGKYLIAEDAGPDTGKDFYAIAEECISLKVAPSTVSLMRSTVEKIRSYQGGCPLSIDDIDTPWLVGLEKSIGCSVNTRAIHLRNVRTICNYALDQEYTTRYPFRKYKIRRQATRDRSLSAESLRTFLAFPCADWQVEYRDIFELIFLLRGINVVDLVSLTDKDVHNGRIEYDRRKTGKHYSIRIEPEAQTIIDRYKGREHLISVLDRYANHKDWSHHCNRALQRIGMTYNNGRPVEGRPLIPDITTYYARYTWASLAAELDIPRETIAAGLGHSWADVTAIYIRTDMRRKVDEANRKIINYLLKEDAL